MPRTPPQEDAPETRAGRGVPSRGSLPDLTRQLAAFTGIGVVMTLAYLALYVVLRGALGAQAANAVSWVATAMVDTSANRRFTFGVSGRAGAVRAQVEGLLVFGLGLVVTSGSLFGLELVVATPSRALEVGVLAVSNLVAGLLRFALLRWWVFAPGRWSAPTGSSRPAGE